MKIFFSILSNFWIHSHIAIKLPRWTKENPFVSYIESSTDRPIANNRNKIVKRFLASDCTHLLMLDNDTIPAKNPLDLIQYDKDIISCPVPIYQHTMAYNVFNYDENEEYLIPLKKQKGLVEIDATGTGCILISRKALEQIKAPFERLYDEDGIERKGLDLAFCEKAKNKGFRIFTHFDFESKHYKLINLQEFI